MEAEHKIILLVPILCLAIYWEQGRFTDEQMNIKTRKEEVATKLEELLVFQQTCVMVSSAKREKLSFN